MQVQAWSPNLTAERAEAAGAEFVPKHELFANADVVSVHLILSDRTRNVVDAAALAAMKPTAFLVNTSRAGLVYQSALLDALRKGRIAGAGLDCRSAERRVGAEGVSTGKARWAPRHYKKKNTRA